MKIKVLMPEFFPDCIGDSKVKKGDILTCELVSINVSMPDLSVNNWNLLKNQFELVEDVPPTPLVNAEIEKELIELRSENNALQVEKKKNELIEELHQSQQSEIREASQLTLAELIGAKNFTLEVSE
ncbi:MAG: hypothetical protein GWN64_07835 [Candidatus Thorarchaeota archaeon]|nr:hypothetical protein [Candidatus Thorarchaeota archaeon]